MPSFLFRDEFRGLHHVGGRRLGNVVGYAPHAARDDAPYWDVSAEHRPEYAVLDPIHANARMLGLKPKGEID